jgi:prolyl 4-hydroxylase
MGGKNKKPAVADAVSATSWAPRWMNTRQRKRLCKWFLWLLGPLVGALAVAVFGAERLPDEPASQPAAPAQDVAGGELSDFWSGMDGMPPTDSWAKPDECVAWAGGGECKKNPTFMKANCAFSCAKLDYAKERYFKRCPKPDLYEPALAPGQMRDTFARVMREFPELEPEEISTDPPLVLFHNFLSDEEADAFIGHGRGRYEQSLGVGMTKDGQLGDVPTEIRTSRHGWCQHKGCLDDPHVQRVVQRVSNLTQTPETNAEFAQLVYYHACPTPDDPKCAFYKRHSDYIDGDEHKLQGVRIYTLFTYLNDVPEGGGTRFTDLPNGPVTFQPQRRKALLWPSVLADQPHDKDDRTHHEALPVTAGEKFGANFWIHQYDFKGAHKRGCTAG